MSEWLLSTGIHTAVVTQTSRFFNSVSNNQERGAETIAEHFFDIGRTRPGFIGQDGVDNRKMSAFCKKAVSYGYKVENSMATGYQKVMAKLTVGISTHWIISLITLSLLRKE
ncbi:Uncharacterised protein [Raoultella terrigena]|uniref:Uncharacterized protein n=1 Tax=Raoultella terrigena TaxID=577 RepID=A0A4V6J2J7_RAOTE|nr:Uncharacterised protein [Raoultella terrigena]